MRGNVLQTFHLPLSSMAPTLVPGDRVLVDKLEFALREPERGEVLVLRAPDDRSRKYIKRIIGIPGDRVVIRDGSVFLNGERLEEPERRVIPDRSSHAETEVPEGFYFVLGDNRPSSRDSRSPGFGLVPRADLLGAVEYVFLPLSRFGALE